MIMSERKGFNFYRSYFDVYNELESDADKLSFIDALIKKQFNGIEPELKGMAKFAYISQQHSINQQVKGWEDKTGITLNTPPSVGGSVGGNLPLNTPPSQQGKGKGKGKEKGKGKGIFLKNENIEILNLIEYMNETFQMQIPNWQKLYPNIGLTAVCESFQLENGGKDYTDNNHLRNAINQHWKFLNERSKKTVKETRSKNAHLFSA